MPGNCSILLCHWCRAKVDLTNVKCVHPAMACYTQSSLFHHLQRWTETKTTTDHERVIPHSHTWLSETTSCISENWCHTRIYAAAHSNMSSRMPLGCKISCMPAHAIPLVDAHEILAAWGLTVWLVCPTICCVWELISSSRWQTCQHLSWATK